MKSGETNYPSARKRAEVLEPHCFWLYLSALKQALTSCVQQKSNLIRCIILLFVTAGTEVQNSRHFQQFNLKRCSVHVWDISTVAEGEMIQVHAINFGKSTPEICAAKDQAATMFSSSMCIKERGFDLMHFM